MPNIEYTIVAKNENTKKETTIFTLCNLRIIKIPPNNTNGKSMTDPTHQLADCLGPKAVKVTAIAAGLKICFLFIVSKYFEAIASPAAANKKVRPNPVGFGEIINDKISPVIIEESEFVGASKIYENTLLMTQQARLQIIADISM